MPAIDKQPATAGAEGAAAAAAACEPQGAVQPVKLSDLLGRSSGSLIILLALFGALSIASPYFLTGGNMENLANQVAVFGIIAVGQLFVILTAGIDLSVGSTLGLCGAIAAALLVEGVPTAVAILASVAGGVAIGTLNGALVGVVRLPPFIVTLGMLGMAHGFLLVVTGAETIQAPEGSFEQIANGSLLGLPNLLWCLLAVTATAGFVLRFTVFGRYVYAVGSNPSSARLAGVPVRAVLISVYAISGALAAVGGILITSRLGAAIPTTGSGYELQAIAACVIGGASLFGAKGGAFGALTGALIVATLTNGGGLLGIDSFYLEILIGALIVVAAAVDNWRVLLARVRTS